MTRCLYVTASGIPCMNRIPLDATSTLPNWVLVIDGEELFSRFRVKKRKEFAFWTLSIRVRRQVIFIHMLFEVRDDIWGAWSRLSPANELTKWISFWLNTRAYCTAVNWEFSSLCITMGMHTMRVCVITYRVWIKVLLKHLEINQSNNDRTCA